MNLRLRPVRVDLGLLVAGLAALPLIPLLFGSWFCLPSGSLGGEGAVVVSPERCFNAWTSFAVIDLVLMLAAVAVIALVVMALKHARLPVEPGPVVTVLGVIPFLLVAWRLISPPWAGAGRAGTPFLALACLAAVAGGGILSGRLRGAVRKRGRKGAPGNPGRGPGTRRSAGGDPRPAVAGPGRRRGEFRDFNRQGGPR